MAPTRTWPRYGDYEKEANGLHVSLLDGLREEMPAAKIEFDEGKDISAAVDKVKRAEVVILGLGELQGISGAGFDRTSLDLPDNQETVARGNRRGGRDLHCRSAMGSASLGGPHTGYLWQ